MWKSGVGIERQRFQRAANLERMLVITAFVAVRLLQLRLVMMVESDESSDCTIAVESEQWKVLWVTTEKTTPPHQPPDAGWAFLALARLGGFTDTKRTGPPDAQRSGKAGSNCRSMSRASAQQKWLRWCDQKTVALSGVFCAKSSYTPMRVADGAVKSRPAQRAGPVIIRAPRDPVAKLR